MIISHKHQFIFIKTMKTAGTSIEVFLSQQCGVQDVVTPISPHVEPHVARNFRGRWNPLPEMLDSDLHGSARVLKDWLRAYKYYNHIPARTLKRRVPRDIWDGYFKFCVERNPWDKTLSHYHHVNHRSGGQLTLDEYLEEGDLCLNFDRYTDREGQPLVDRVLRYEALADELGEVFEQLSIPYSGSLGVRAKGEYRKDRAAYQEVFTPAQRSVVEAVFADEIRMHGYRY